MHSLDQEIASEAGATITPQERELRQVVDRAGWEIVKVYKEHGISGAKGRDKRPAFDALHKAAALAEAFKTLLASCPSFTLPASTSSCTSKVSTPRHRPARRCFR